MKRTQVFLPEPMLAAMERLASQKGISKGEIIRRAIEKYLEEVNQMANKIYSEYLGREFDPVKLAQDHGTVEQGGTTYWLTQEAYPVNRGAEGRIAYVATAIDADGGVYEVEWPTVEGWEEHRIDEGGICAVDGCSGYCEDESNACNWDVYTISAT